MANCADSYGFPPYSAIEDFLQRMNGVGQLLEEERRIVASALTGIPATLVGSSTMEWWRELPRIAGVDPTPMISEPQTSLIPISVGD